MTEYPDDDIREALRAARDRQRAIPRELPGPEPTDEQLLRWHDTAGQAGHFTEPGEFITEPDGTPPTGVGPSTTDPIVVSDEWLTAGHRARLDHLLAQRDKETP